jgi:hypothetical protein
MVVVPALLLVVHLLFLEDVHFLVAPAEELELHNQTEMEQQVVPQINIHQLGVIKQQGVVEPLEVLEEFIRHIHALVLIMVDQDHNH